MTKMGRWTTPPYRWWG